MEFTNHNDLDLVLKLEHHGKPFRVADCVRFEVRVWTQNANNFLLFTPREVIADDHRDRLVIPDYMMKTLESGVVVYEYSYSISDRHFKPFEGHNHKHNQRVVTDMYWKNSNHNQIPSNPVNFQSLNYLRDLIEQEVADRENAIIDLRDYFNDGFINRLTDEIERATAAEIELATRLDAKDADHDNQIAELKAKDDALESKIDYNKTVADGCVDALLEKIEENKDNADKVADALNSKIDANKELYDTAVDALQILIDSEETRAKEAERQLGIDLNDEVNRAKVAENTLDSKVDAEASRAKIVENALTTSVDAAVSLANQINSLVSTKKS